jgi:hypothetical protein
VFDDRCGSFGERGVLIQSVRLRSGVPGWYLCPTGEYLLRWWGELSSCYASVRPRQYLFWSRGRWRWRKRLFEFGRGNLPQLGWHRGLRSDRIGLLWQSSFLPGRDGLSQWWDKLRTVVRFSAAATFNQSVAALENRVVSNRRLEWPSTKSNVLTTKPTKPI